MKLTKTRANKRSDCVIILCSAMDFRRPPKFLVIIFALAIPVLFFSLGAVAHKKCVFPFCRGFVDGGNGQPPILTQVAGDGAQLIERDWKFLRTNLHAITMDRIKLPLSGHNGALAHFGMNLLVASNQGELIVLDKTRRQYAVSFSVPVSRESFVGAVKTRREDGDEGWDFPLKWYGLKDILVVPVPTNEGEYNLFASYHHWRTDESCYTLRFSHTRFIVDGSSIIKQRGSWKTVYETSPCLPLKKKKGETRFAGHMAGGRIEHLEDTDLLLSIGDHAFDGNGSYMSVHNSKTSYGKIIRLDYLTGETSTVSTGHRNPQGLHVDAQGTMWSTEHGPEGGDELNLIREGHSYGWPHITYGTNYGSFTYSMSSTSDEHTGYELPIYSWVPSIGISQLTSITRDAFSRWKGDLIVSSLNGKELYRVRVRDSRAVVVEPLSRNTQLSRMRDMLELPDGTIAIKNDGNRIYLLRPSDSPASEPSTSD